MPSENNDLTDSFMAKAKGDAAVNDTVEMEAFLAAQPKQQQVQPPPVALPQVESDPARPAPTARPLRRKTDDSLGRLDAERDRLGASIGSAGRNIAEIPRQILGGLDDAARNAFSMLTPLTNWLDENVADLKYDPVTAPKTGTGTFTRKASEFLSGFIPALKGLKAAGVTGKIVAPVAAGVIADFVVRSPHEGRLADLWNAAELPKNILTDYLSSNPADSNIEGRFKNAIEGAGMGLAGEGVFMAARALRAMKGVRGVKQTEDAYLRGKYGEVSEAEFVASGLGDLRSPAVSHSPTVAAKKLARGAMETATTDPRALIRGTPRGQKSAVPTFDTYINFARIDEPDQVKFVIGKMAEKLRGTIDEAARGKITQAETQAMADDLGMGVGDLLARRQGQAFNAEQIVAARQLWAASGEKLLEMAKRAAGPNAGPIDQFAFRKMMATHAAVQAEVLGARAEAGRGLAAWAIPAGGSVEKARAIEQVLGAMGGTSTSKEMAQRLAMLGEAGANPAVIARFAEAGNAATTMDQIKEVWVNGLLSSPKTHVVNLSSNTLVVAQQIYERGAAAALRSFTGGEGVVHGEAGAMAYGLITSVKDAFVLAAKALRTGESSFGRAHDKFDLVRTNALSAEGFRMSKETAPGRFVDFLGNAVNVPGRLLRAEDEFFKTIGYRMELHAQSLRQASQEGLRGDALRARIAELVSNPTEAIRINSADAALYSTFTNDVGNFGRAVMSLRDHVPAVTFVMPFVRTPVNIARYAFERTPLAPLVGQWRADIAAGGARADLALARMSTGTAIMLTAMDYADSGMISGAGPGQADKDTREAMMRQGWKPFSVKAGDRWYSYNRVDPLGMTLGLAAMVAEATRRGDIDEDSIDEWNEVTAMAIATVSQVAINKTYLQGASKFVEMMSDPTRYSEKYISDLTASFVPGTALMAAVKNAADPIQRETNSPWEAVQARIIGLSENLTPRRNLWGEKISTESGLGGAYDFMSPVTSSEQINSPIDRELVRLDSGPLRITKKAPFAGVRANFKQYPKAYDDYVRLAGNDLKHPAWNMGAKDYLNAVVEGKHPMSAMFSIMSDESRRAFIQNTITGYRQLAQQQVMGDPRHGNFAAEVAQLQQIHQAGKMPVLGE